MLLLIHVHDCLIYMYSQKSSFHIISSHHSHVNYIIYYYYYYYYYNICYTLNFAITGEIKTNIISTVTSITVF